MVALSFCVDYGSEVSAFFLGVKLPIVRFYGPAISCGMLTAQQVDGALLDNHAGIVLDGMEVRIGEQNRIQYSSPEGWCDTGEAGSMTRQNNLKLLGYVGESDPTKNGKTLVPRFTEDRLSASRFIKRAIVLEGSNTNVGALVELDLDASKMWVDSKGITYDSGDDLSDVEEVHSLIGSEISEVNKSLVAEGLDNQCVRRFAILKKDLDSNMGELTHLRKPCHTVIKARYGELVGALFTNEESCTVPVGSDHNSNLESNYRLGSV